MKLSAPTFLIFLISVILLALGLLMILNVFHIDLGISNLPFWLAFVGGGLLALGALFKGL